MKHVPALDGIRGLSILLVLAFHVQGFVGGLSTDPVFLERIFHPIIRYGWAGVDLFFVLSGFLITGILLESKGREKYFSNFYARRFLRIFPVYYLGLIVILWLIPFVIPYAGFDSLQKLWFWFFAYLQNWAIAFDQIPLGDMEILGHFWSLAIEEQFYIIWPFIVWRASDKSLFWICLTVVLILPIVRAVMLLNGLGAYQVYINTFARIDSLLAGALLVIAMNSGVNIKLFRRLIRPAFHVGWLGLLGLYLALGSVTFTNKIILVIAPSLNILIAITLIYSSVYEGKRISARIFSNSALRVLGKYSYAIYIIHVPVLVLLQARLQDLSSHISPPFSFLLTLLIVGVLSLMIALLSWHLLEKYCLKLKTHFS